MFIKNTIIFIFYLTFLSHGYAWNDMGHQLVAQIAINQLPKSYVDKLSRLNHEMDVIYPTKSLVYSANWMDNIRWSNNQWYTSYHYEDGYFSDDNTPLPKRCGRHASWAIKNAINTLESHKTTPYNKAMSLRIILHVVGDIHQPLHSISRVTKLHPKGDSGGNFYGLKDNTIGHSLHEYWDKGGGYLIRKKPYKNKDILVIANQLARKHPCKSFALAQLDIQAWLNESRRKAVNFIYSPLKGGGHISDEYQQKAQALSQYQLSLAGCRLANLLENIHIRY